ncbi:MAG TPA: hypothetical protein VKA74_00710 [Myxococcota bacterium]|nr:hypothetical protein [Myxococcota bacterium]
MITVALSSSIGATRDRVWRALTALEERPVWDDRVIGRVTLEPAGLESRRNRSSPISPPARAAAPGESRRSVRWRYRLSGIPLVMHEDLLRVCVGERIESRISIGSLRLEQVFTLHAEEDPEAPRIRLGMKVISGNSIAVMGDVVPRLDVQKLMIELVDTTLRQIRRHCEIR